MDGEGCQLQLSAMAGPPKLTGPFGFPPMSGHAELGRGKEELLRPGARGGTVMTAGGPFLAAGCAVALNLRAYLASNPSSECRGLFGTNFPSDMHIGHILNGPKRLLSPT